MNSLVHIFSYLWSYICRINSQQGALVGQRVNAYVNLLDIVKFPFLVIVPLCTPTSSV